MARLQHIEIDGKRYLWRELLQLRREQKKAHARALQPALFELLNSRSRRSQSSFATSGHPRRSKPSG